MVIILFEQDLIFSGSLTIVKEESKFYGEVSGDRFTGKMTRLDGSIIKEG